MRFGVHVSISGDLARAVARAKERNCETIQIFSSNPRSWKGKEFSKSEIGEFKKGCWLEGLEPVVAHTPYLLNLASPHQGLWSKSVEALAEALKSSELLGCDYLVTHLGSHAGAGEVEGLKRISSAISVVMKGARAIELLLENSAGAGFSLGYSWEQLALIVSELNYSQRVGVCLDTCHAFAAGYDLVSKESLSRMIELFDRLLGLERLKLIHANDSKGSIGSRLDRHESLGKGSIGESGFRLIVNHPQLKSLPCILETPGMGLEDDIRNLAFLRSLVQPGAGARGRMSND